MVVNLPRAARPGEAAAGPAHALESGRIAASSPAQPDPAAFVRAVTAVRAVAFVPEISLHLADDAIALWEQTELVCGQRQPPPFWGFAWAGGQALARHLLDNPALVAGRRVLDVASGCGLVAIAAARAGAAQVTADEVDPFAAAAIRLNAEANDALLDVVLADLLDGTADTTCAVPAAEVVLAGDVFYSRELATRMLGFLARAHRRGAVVLVGDPGRAYRPVSGFTEIGAYQVPVLAGLEDADVKATSVLRMTGRAAQWATVNGSVSDPVANGLP